MVHHRAPEPSLTDDIAAVAFLAGLYLLVTAVFTIPVRIVWNIVFFFARINWRQSFLFTAVGIALIFATVVIEDEENQVKG